MAVSTSDLLLLGQYDTPTISNVIELFEVRARREGFMDRRIRAWFPELSPIVGYASTATMRTAYPRAEGDVYSGLDEQVARFAELPGPAIVVFEDLDDPPVGATFGEVMCASYQCFGARGIITNGPARDLEQVRRLGFPAFSDGVVSSHADSHITSLHQPIRVGGLAVRPGDLLHADANGVCGIPEDIAAYVAHAAQEFVAAEAVCIDCARSWNHDMVAYAAARREMVDRIAALGKRVRAKQQPS